MARTPSRKNPNGSGTVYQRQRDGRWIASISLGGRRIVRYTGTRKEALGMLQELQGANRAGLLSPPSKLTVAQYLGHWLETVGPDLKPKTLAGYEQDCRNYLAPTFGHLRLQHLEPAHVLAAIAQWRRRTSPGTLNHIYRSLRRALTLAVKWGVIPANPCARVDPPRATPPAATVWTVDQARAFLRAAQDDRWYALWAFLAGTGARLGEALGLEWRHLDLEHGTVAIDQNLVWLGGTPILGTPKTRASVRTLTLPPFVAGVLRKWRTAQLQDRLAAGPDWQDERGAVFTTLRGRPPTESYLRRVFLATCARADVPPCRLHDLRHLAATLLVAAGVDPKGVQARLGHATLAMTLGLYAHAVPAGDALAASALERALG